MMSMFSSIDEVRDRLAQQKYICSKEIATVIFLAEKLEKPVLVEGPAGVGKTDLGKVTAAAMDREFIRLQCYEGLDEAKSLYEWEYSKQLLYTQILKDVLAEELADAKSLAEAVDRVARQDEVFFSQKFIVPRPLLKAITSERPALILIDEVDKSDPEFEAFLLEILSDFQVSIPELETLKAKHIPMVVLTSNNARELSDALKRRCLHLFIDFPDWEQELEIVRLKVPGIEERLAEQVVKAVQRLRKLDIKKTPGISETLDWARALVVLNAESLDQEMVKGTLNIILKYEKDIQKAKDSLRQIVEG
jgi:MoxR-like ATPase